MKKRFVIIVIVAVVLAVIALVPIFIPQSINLLPCSFRTELYFNFVSSFSVTLGTIASVMFLLLTFTYEQHKFRELEKERNHRKYMELINTFLDRYESVKKKITYRGKEGDDAVEHFYEKIKEYFGKDTVQVTTIEALVPKLKKAVDGSVFTKGGFLNLYKRAVQSLALNIYQSQSKEMIPFWEDNISSKEKALLFYLFKFYFPESIEFKYLLNNGFLNSIDPKVLISDNHIEWL